MARPRTRRKALTPEDIEIMRRLKTIQPVRVAMDEDREAHAASDWRRRAAFMPRDYQVLRDMIYYPDYRTSTKE